MVKSGWGATDSTSLQSADVDVIVVGGGSFGAAVAYGLVRQGLDTVILDGSDDSLRAARGNFGLVLQPLHPRYCLPKTPLSELSFLRGPGGLLD